MKPLCHFDGAMKVPKNTNRRWMVMIIMLDAFWPGSYESDYDVIEESNFRVLKMSLGWNLCRI